MNGLTPEEAKDFSRKFGSLVAEIAETAHAAEKCEAVAAERARIEKIVQKHMPNYSHARAAILLEIEQPEKEADHD